MKLTAVFVSKGIFLFATRKSTLKNCGEGYKPFMILFAYKPVDFKRRRTIAIVHETVAVDGECIVSSVASWAITGDTISLHPPPLGIHINNPNPSTLDDYT